MAKLLQTPKVEVLCEGMFNFNDGKGYVHAYKCRDELTGKVFWVRERADAEGGMKFTLIDFGGGSRPEWAARHANETNTIDGKAVPHGITHGYLGGWVSYESKLDDTAVVDWDAAVMEESIMEANSRLEGESVLGNGATACENAVITNNSWVIGEGSVVRGRVNGLWLIEGKIQDESPDQREAKVSEAVGR